MKKYFGTDGIRGRVGKPPISADWVLQLGFALGRVLKEQYSHSLGRLRVLIGKDTRISGYLLESALEAGLSSAGIDVLLLGPMPTPAIAFLTRSLRAEAGIVISASHNPYDDNGIKFFSAQGTKLPDEMELAIEAALDLPFEMQPSERLGKVSRLRDAEGRYIEFCKASFPHDLSLQKLKIVIDCANGAAFRVAPTIFHELGAETIEIGVHPDGFNINHQCGAMHPEHLVKHVLQEKADVGLALDGDGDRLIMVDDQGKILDGDDLLWIIAKWYKETERLQGGVVGTLMSNLGLELALKSIQIPFARTSVGDRYILARLQENHWNLGGETSGHIICLDASTSGDGIISALRILAVMCSKKVSLADLRQGLTKYPQTLINVSVARSETKKVMDHPKVQAAVKAASQRLQDRGRILLRPSGTEALLRVMVEGEDMNTVREIADQVADLVREISQGN